MGKDGEDDRVLVCHRMADMVTPHVASYQRACDGCGCLIWVARSSPSAQHYWCTRCAADEARHDPDATIGKVTEEQLADLANYYNRR